MSGLRRYCAAIALFVAWPLTAEIENESRSENEARVATGAVSGVVERLLAAVEEPTARLLAGEILQRNPGLARADAKVRAAALRAPQAGALSDPVASLTGFVSSPETRTGSQILSLGLSQSLPGLGKRQLREQSALLGAAELEAGAQAERLRLVTEGRRLYYELAFLGRYEEISRDFLAHLSHHEEVARSRYSTGIGPGQGVIKLQAEITRVESRRLDIERRRSSVLGRLNTLRDRPATFEDGSPTLPLAAEVRVDAESLVDAALAGRPEVVAAEVRISRAEIAARLAEKGYRPDFRIGLTWTVVDSRNDMAGRIQPPQGNGDDVLGIQGGVTLPVWRKRLAAGVDEAAAMEVTAAHARRGVIASIRGEVGDLAQAVPLDWHRLRLVEDLLIVQAEEALESAQAGYVAGTLNALDLFDAEHDLYEARTAVARAAADYLIGLARLEGAIGESLARVEDETTRERSDS